MSVQAAQPVTYSEEAQPVNYMTQPQVYYTDPQPVSYMMEPQPMYTSNFQSAPSMVYSGSSYDYSGVAPSYSYTATTDVDHSKGVWLKAGEPLPEGFVIATPPAGAAPPTAAELASKETASKKLSSKKKKAGCC
ncbi:unnamed protein product [Polarella glacialis]|uniref:Uncharacterized protein n=1 Tax=Polarella glacialis TaxID=89957 RepID=A0A813HXA2_POLGL|nr:unnamed protein product [Polarella glacialis]